MKELIKIHVEKHLDIVALAVSVLVLNFMLELNFQSVIIFIFLFLSIKLLHLRLFDKTSSTNEIIENTTLLVTLTLGFFLNKSFFIFFVSFSLVFILMAIISANIKTYIDSVFLLFISLFSFWFFFKPYDNSIIKYIFSIPYAYESYIVWTSLVGLLLIFLSDKKFDVLSLLLIRQFAIFFSIYFKQYFNQSILIYVVIACDVYIFYHFIRFLTHLFLFLLGSHKCVIIIIQTLLIILFFPPMLYWPIIGYETDMCKTVFSLSNIASQDDLFVTDNKKLELVYKFFSKWHGEKCPKIYYIDDLFKDLMLLNKSKYIFMTTQNKVPFRKIWKLEKLQGVFKTYSYDSNNLSNNDKIIEIAYFFSKNKRFYNKISNKYKFVFNDIPVVPIGENIIYNPNFEFDLNGWEYLGPAGPTFNSLFSETNNFYYLKWALNTSAKYWAYLNQNIYLSAGLYEMAFDMKAFNKGSHEIVNFSSVLNAPDGNIVCLISPNNINTEWKFYSKTFSIRNNGYYTLSLMYGGKWNSIINLKNIQIVKIK